MGVTAFSIGNQLVKEGKLEEAIASYQKSIEENPQFVYSYQNLAKVLEEVGRKNEAIAALRQAVAIEPQTPLLLNKLGIMLSEEGQFQEAVDYLRQALDIKKDVCAFYLDLANALVKLKKWSEVEDSLEQAGMLNGKVTKFQHAEINYYLAEAKSGQKQWSEAVEFYQRSWDIDSARVDCGIGLAKALGKLGRWSEAVESYRQMVAESRASGEVFCGLGQALGELGRWEEAVGEYRKAIGLGFVGTEVRHNLGYAYGQLGRWEEAVVEYRLVLEVNPESAQVRHQLGYALMRLEYWREAEIELRKAVELYPESAVVWQQLGDVLINLNKSEEAFEAFKLGEGINNKTQNLPNKWEQYFQRGNKLKSEKNYQEAILAYQKAIAENPLEFWSNCNLALAYQSLEKWNEAIHFCYRSIEINPGENLPYLALKETITKQWSNLISKGDVLVRQGDRKLADLTYKEAIFQCRQSTYIPDISVPKEIPTKPSVIIVFKDNLNDKNYYRLQQRVEQLEHTGFLVDSIPYQKIGNAKNMMHFYHVVIFFRIPAVPKVIEAVLYAKAIKKILFYEVDDLIFDPKEEPKPFETYCDQITRKEYQDQIREVIQFREIMALFDYGIASTPSLLQEMQKLVTKTVFLHRNAIDTNIYKFLKNSFPKEKPNHILIFYCQDTKACNPEFEKLAAPALASIFKNYPQVRLTIVGYLTLPPVLKPFEERIKLLGILEDIKAYWDFLKQADISIDVLDQSKSNNCKSEIKWLESAVFGIPSVISATQTYLEVVEHGVNGLIARTSKEWYDNLEILITNQKLRNSIAKSAEDKVRKNYNIPVMAENIKSIIMTGIDEAIEKGNLVARTTKKKLLIVNVFYPPQTFGGATIIVQNNVDTLQKKYSFKYEICIFTTDYDNPNPYEISEYTFQGIHITKVSIPKMKEMDWQYQNTEVYEIFKNYLKFYQPDLIHFHSVQHLTASVLEAATYFHVPYLVTVHDAWWISDHQFLINAEGKECDLQQKDIQVTANDNETENISNSIHRRQYLRKLLNQASAILAVSESFTELYRLNGFPQTQSNRNGIMPRPKLSRKLSSSTKVRLAHIGGMTAHKGYFLFKEAVELAATSNLEIIVINHSARDVTYKKWNQAPVTYIPRVPQEKMPELYSKIDVLVAPSIWPESYGLVTREAAAAGVWVVASNKGALAEDLVVGVNGDVFNPDNIQELVDILRKIDREPEFYKQLVSVDIPIRATEEQVKELEEIYQSILSSDESSNLGNKKDEVAASDKQMAKLNSNVKLEQNNIENELENNNLQTQLNTNQADYYYSIGKEKFEKGEFEEAIKNYRQAIEFNPNQTEIHEKLGEALFKVEKWQEAAHEYSLEIAIQPQSAPLHHYLGFALSKLENWQEAANEYIKSIEIYPQSIVVHSHLWEALQQLGQERVVDYYSRAIEVHPNSSVVHEQLWNALVKVRTWEKALQMYSKVVGQHPKSAILQHYMGEILAKLQRWDASAAAYRQALTINPNSATLYQRLGEVLLIKQEWYEAIAVYRKAIDLKPDNPKYYCKIGEILTKTKQYDKAIKYYQDAIKLNPDFAQSYFRLYELWLARGKLEKANPYYETFWKLQQTDVENEINQQIATYFPSLNDNLTVVKKTTRPKRIIIVLTAIALLNVLTTLRSHQKRGEYQDCDDYLVIGRGSQNRKADIIKGHANVILQVAKIWNFKQVFTVYGVEDLFSRQNFDFPAATEWIKQKLKINEVNVLYVQANSAFINELFLTAYPQAKKIAYGDALGMLKLNEGISPNPYGHPRIDEASLITPYEFQENVFNHCQITQVDALLFDEVVSDAAKKIEGLQEYCAKIPQENPGLITIVLTEYFYDAKAVDNIETEVYLYTLFTLSNTKPEDTILIKGHPYQHHNQSGILADRLRKYGRKVVEIKELTHVPIELFLPFLPKIDKAITPLSSSSVSIAYLTGCKVAFRIGEKQIKKYLKSNFWYFLTVERAYQLQVRQAAQKKFTPITYSQLHDRAEFTGNNILDAEKENNLSREIRPKSDQDYYLLGEECFKKGKLDEALIYLREAIEINPNYYECYSRLGEVLRRQRQWQEATKIYSRAIELNSSNWEDYFKCGSAWEHQRKYEKSEACYRQAVKLNPQRSHSHHKLGDVLLHQGKLGEAAVSYKQSIELKPDTNNHIAYNQLGDILNRQGDLDKSIYFYRQAIDWKKDEWKSYWGLGTVIEKRARGALVKTWEPEIQEVINCYQRVVELQPKNFEANYKLGEILQGEGKLEHAIDFYSRAIELKPQHFQAYQNLGETFELQGDLDKAIDCYRRVIELNKNFPRAYLKLAEALTKFDKQSKKVAEAIAYYKRAILLKPDYAQAYFYLYQLLDQQQRKQEAAIYKKQFLELQTDEVEVYIHQKLALGKVQLESQTNHDDARKTKVTRRLIVIQSVQALLNVSTVLRYQQAIGEFQNCEDFLVIPKGRLKYPYPDLDAAKGMADMILQIADSWQFKQVFTLHGIQNVFCKHKGVDFTLAVEWVKQKINLPGVDVIYVGDNFQFHYEAFLEAYPNARKICYGDAWGMLKLNIRKSHHQFSHIPIDDAYLTIPYEIAQDNFKLCKINSVPPEFMKEVVKESAIAIKGFREYCQQLTSQIGNGYSTVFCPSRLTDLGLTDLESEIDLCLSHIFNYTEINENILVKGHPFEENKLSKIIVDKLQTQGYKAMMVNEFNQVPIEVFTNFLKIDKFIGFFSTSQASMAYLCRCKLIFGCSEKKITTFYRNLRKKGYHIINQYVLYLFVQQAYQNKAFEPLSYASIQNSSQNFPEFPLIIE